MTTLEDLAARVAALEARLGVRKWAICTLESIQPNGVPLMKQMEWQPTIEDVLLELKDDVKELVGASEENEESYGPN